VKARASRSSTAAIAPSGSAVITAAHRASSLACSADESRSQAKGKGGSWNTITPSLAPSPAAAGRITMSSARAGSRKWGLGAIGIPPSGLRSVAR
jgi:hypothetical protein